MKIITQREPEIIITHVAEAQNKVKLTFILNNFFFFLLYFYSFFNNKSIINIYHIINFNLYVFTINKSINLKL